MKKIFKEQYEDGEAQLNYFELAFCAEYLSTQAFVSKIQHLTATSKGHEKISLLFLLIERAQQLGGFEAHESHLGRIAGFLEVGGHLQIEDGELLMIQFYQSRISLLRKMNKQEELLQELESYEQFI